jgi:hypothetical protein
MPIRSLAISITFAGLIAVGLVSPTPVAASDGITATATQVYELKPQQNLVHVTVDMGIKNTTPSWTTYEPCIKYYWDPYWGLQPYSTTCPHTTNYYVNDSTLWVEDGARNLKLSADVGQVSKAVTSKVSGFTEYDLKFQKIFYGHTRKVHVSYDLPSAAPRSVSGIRAGSAYASFCVSGNGPDGGQIRVVAPAAFSLTQTNSSGLTFSKASSGSRTTYSSGSLGDPILTWACFEGINLDGYAVQTVQASAGHSVVVESWPEDPAWGAAVAEAVQTSLPALEALLGRPLPGNGALEIREVAGLGDYAGFFSEATNVAVVGEDFTQGGLVAHELSHAWFNVTNFESTWLNEGYAEWVGSQNGGSSCDRLPVYPGAGKPNLEVWQFLGPKATPTDRAVVGYQYDAACWLVASVADRIGTVRMTVVLGSLLDGISPYGSTVAGSAKPATWQAWLDAVDELGMVPAGESDLDLVQKELTQVGVAADSTTLAARSAARAAYHELETTTGTWVIPEAVRSPLTSWDFGGADRAIESAQAAYADAQRAETTLPEIDALRGPIERQWEAARSLADLDQVAALAHQEAAAADAIVAARTVEVQADPITRVGLIGTDTSPMFDSAIAAAREAKPDVAIATTATITATLEAGQGAGVLRIVLAAAVLAVVAFTLVMLRRRHRGHPVDPLPTERPAVAADQALEPIPVPDPRPDVPVAPRAGGRVWTPADPHPAASALQRGTDSTDGLATNEG